MNNKEIADKIRSCLMNGEYHDLADFADELDPYVPKFPVGTYVICKASGDTFIMADKKEWLREDGSELAIEKNYPLFFSSDGCAMYSSGEVNRWVPDPKEKNPWFDKNGNICPANFGKKRKFEKGKIYYDRVEDVIRFFDGTKFVMPGQSDLTFSEMGNSTSEATEADIKTYFKDYHGVTTAVALAKAFANKM